LKPVVDRLEEQYNGQLDVVRVDIQSSAGRAIAGEFGVLVTPTFMFFDAQGQEIQRMVGSLNEELIKRTLEDR
jgi:thioredoxin-like negative regulator of GroEL